ncbi:probable tRNA (guanine(26)-N(2))-dimethyltransferase 2 isoform X3 [Macadamia integrifolia]|uniref:probable tRNA (guanine(26)-N(2))-dimethyltransferase 2 isoform X3 n=1 Tax=Macadamia integrifolia TaxID=60698 RepID=UPI001C4E36CB|nr:probable tRNA (guanine(26)-N(2))-dimethyltransferase 2 isoform X3 [Macadamia integrifolia]
MDEGEGSHEKLQHKSSSCNGLTSVDPNDYTIIKEGEAEIIMLAKNEVFYNKAQVNNRDLSIAVLRTFISKRKEEHAAMLAKRNKAACKASEDAPGAIEEAAKSMRDSGKPNGECEVHMDPSQNESCDISLEPFKTTEGRGPEEPKPPKVLEALAASGLRALRYACEVEGIGKVVALDNDKVSVEACKRNIRYNGSVALSKVESHLADARVFMLTHLKEFEVVDLDPYGSPSVFLDSAVQSVVDGGMLMCTATDMAVLCGSNGEVCYSKYGSYPLRGKYCHEMALRILLACIENKSVRYLPGFGPVVPQECSDCKKKFNMGGPIWSAPIHDQEWVDSILANVKSMKSCYPAYDRISAVLTTISEELVDVPLFVSLHSLCATLKCTSPSAVMFRSAVINGGYRISGTHVNPLGLKSDAPMDVIWDIMRCWVKNHPVKAQSPDQSGSVILAKEPTLQANFARAVASLSKAQAKKVARFLPNPERHWGPKLRAGRQITSKHVSLLGPDAVNNSINHEGDECNAKRHKTDNSTSSPS